MIPLQPLERAHVDRELSRPVESTKPCCGEILFRAAQKLVEQKEELAGVVYGLSSSIYTRDINKAFTAMRDMYTGIFYVNAPTIGAEIRLPLGGTKETGNGHREAGIAAIDAFSEWKSVYLDFSGKLQRAQIDIE